MLPEFMCHPSWMLHHLHVVSSRGHVLCTHGLPICGLVCLVAIYSTQLGLMILGRSCMSVPIWLSVTGILRV